MPRDKLSMRKTKDILRLKFENGLSNRAIAHSCQVSRSTVADYLCRAERAGLSWPLLESLTDTALEQLLFPPLPACPEEGRPLPKWAAIHEEMRGKGVTLMLLWQEYKAQHPNGYQYSQFAQRYRQWRETLDVTMRQTHTPGEKLFVDYAGQTVPVVDKETGECHPAQIFVAVLGASHYTYCEATWSQSTDDWIASHVRAFDFLQGCPAIVVPDNLKSAVTRSHRYEPDINPAYQDLLCHYGVAVVPARVAKPQDKSAVENGVQRVEQWVLARLRHLPFFSLAELNAHLHRLLEELNAKPFQKLPGSRRSQFESLERAALKPLPVQRYELAHWFKARVALNIHIRIEGCYYSVPYRLAKQEVDVRLTATTLEVLYRGERVASHPRSLRPGSYTTTPAHMPEGHQQHLEWTPERLMHWAQERGAYTEQMIQTVLASRPHPQQAFNACLGIMRLGKSYGVARLEAACRRALHLGTSSYKSVASILKHGLDQHPLPATAAMPPSPTHDNLRGATYFH